MAEIVQDKKANVTVSSVGHMALKLAITADIVREQDSVEHTIRSQSEDDFKQYGISQDDLEKAYDEACNMSVDQSRAHLRAYLDDHGDDMLIPASFTASVEDLVARLSSPDEKLDPTTEVEARLVAAVFHGNSVYREVRATFMNTDDTNTPCGTIRAWAIGLIWACGLAGLNQFFGPRNPSITVSVYLAQLFCYPMGRLCAATLPTKVFLPGTRFAFTLNPGPFTIKEHMLITIMCNVSTSSTTSTTPMFFEQALPLFFGQEWAAKWGYQACVLLSMQIFGFSLAGMVRRYIVYPPQMIYYFNLSQASLNNALHNANDSHVNSWRISRYKFFMIAFTAMFCYFWLPNTIFPTLTYFNWPTWIKPHGTVLSTLMGSYYYNLGLNPFINTFDWNVVAAVVDPIVNPFFVVVQIVGSLMVWGVCVIIPVFFSNLWYTAYMPINSWYIYDNTGEEYSMSQVMGSNGGLNQTAYEEYSPAFIPAAAALRYAVSLATVPAVVTFAYLYYGKTFTRIAKNAWKRKAGHEGHEDIHSRLMSRYEEVPERSDLLAFTPGLLEYPDVGGYAVQNHPVAYVLFSTMSVGVLSQSMAFVTDMKLAHYAKVPPKQMFTAQVVATMVSALVVLAVVQFQLGVEGMCNPEVSVHWNVHARYWKIMFALIAGLFWPVPWYYAKKMWPKSILRYAHPLVMMMGGVVWAPNNLSMFWESLYFSYFFGVYVKNRWPGWWAKYALVLASALASGMAISGLVQFFAITNSGATVPNWWGTTQYESTCDFQDCRYKSVAPGQTFGPTEWH
ncbi:hypothetical protein LTR85_012169 [Meristemomyces frigidus]|nr:hypothetical protein LTR85_012169 [Meristemomyces frigidus]